MQRQLWVLPLIALVLTVSGKADPVIFDLSPSAAGPYSSGMYAATDRFINQNFYMPVSFPLGATVTGMSIYSRADWGLTVGEPLVVDIYDTNPFGNPGGSIDTMFVSATAIDTQGTVNGLNDIRVYAPFSAPVVMAPGQQLWFSMSGNNNDPTIYLMSKPNPQLGDVYQFGPGYNGYIPGQVPAMQLFGTVVPEPTSLSLIGFAAVALSRRCRQARRRRHHYINSKSCALTTK